MPSCAIAEPAARSWSASVAAAARAATRAGPTASPPSARATATWPSRPGPGISSPATRTARRMRSFATFAAPSPPRARAAAPRQQTASPVKPLTAHQEPRGIGNLVAPGDRVHIVYTLDTPRVRSPKGALYVRNDLQRRFTHLPLKLQGRTTLQASVPARLI